MSRLSFIALFLFTASVGVLHWEIDKHYFASLQATELAVENHGIENWDAGFSAGYELGHDMGYEQAYTDAIKTYRELRGK